MENKKKKQQEVNYRNIITNRMNLKIGEKYNYKQITQLLDIKYDAKSGETKKKQLRIIERLYIFDKVGTKYYIKGYNDISNEELEALIENRRGKNPNSYGNNNTGGGKELASVFLRKIYSIALEEDINTENGILKGDNDTIYLSLSKHEIACISGIRNDANYKIANNYPGYYSNYYNLDYALVKNIFSFLSNATYNIVNSMIEIINKEKLALIETYMDI